MRITSNVKRIYISISRQLSMNTLLNMDSFSIMALFGNIIYIIRMLKHFQGPQTCVWPQRFYDVDYVWGVVKRKSVFTCMCIHLCFFFLCVYWHVHLRHAVTCSQKSVFPFSSCLLAWFWFKMNWNLQYLRKPPGTAISQGHADC